MHVPPQSDPTDAATSGDDGEVIDAVPVLAGTPGALDSAAAGERLPQEHRTVIPAVQAAAVAAGGFVAGAAVVGLVHRHTRRSNALVKGTRRGGRRVGRSRAGELAQVVGSRSFLVDVHLLGGAGGDR